MGHDMSQVKLYPSQVTQSMHSSTVSSVIQDYLDPIHDTWSLNINSKLLFTLILSFGNLIVFYYIDTIRLLIQTIYNIMCYVTLTQIHIRISKSVLEIKLDLETTVRDKK